MTPRLDIDHIVVSAERLEDGVAYVEETLGVRLATGGKHPAMGTHNRLLGLGPYYLEVIAADPEAEPPAIKRWFDLDRFAGPPRITNWVARTSDLAAAIDLAPNGIGAPMRLTRDDLEWLVAVSEDGTLPFKGAFPGLIAWGDTPHPTTRLPDVGCRLATWTSPAAAADALACYDGGLSAHAVSQTPTFRAEIATPHGIRVMA